MLGLSMIPLTLLRFISLFIEEWSFPRHSAISLWEEPFFSRTEISFLLSGVKHLYKSNIGLVWVVA